MAARHGKVSKPQRKATSMGLQDAHKKRRLDGICGTKIIIGPLFSRAPNIPTLFPRSTPLHISLAFMDEGREREGWGKISIGRQK
jgi:hypothetical protein